MADKAVSFITKMMEDAKQEMVTAIRFLATEIETFIKGIPKDVKEFLSTMKQGATATVDDVGAVLKTVYRDIHEALSTVAGSIVGKLKSTLDYSERVLASIVTHSKAAFEAIIGEIANITRDGFAVMRRVMVTAKSDLGSLLDGAVFVVDESVVSLERAVADIGHCVETGVKNLTADTIDIGEDLTGDIGSVLDGGVSHFEKNIVAATSAIALEQSIALLVAAGAVSVAGLMTYVLIRR